MWHEPTAAAIKTAAALKKKTAASAGRAKKRPAEES
jgi:hypothetical protein